ncbi:hypothetical protein MKW94_029571 [Papaver nudicaule]|uniref:Scarecrow-like protein 32 n=1 Tax=Papaver nudicaule TaxID=74823 RepID=A0AA41S9H2_PAPNU|nr:hypothetical protein [Papaver nudicaule]
MQFTETPPPPLHQNSISPCSNFIMSSKNNSQFHRTRPWPGFSTPSNKALGSVKDANCMEQLLVHCANAIESNDATLAQQILWVLNNTAPPDGDSNQRLTCGFLRALISRAAMTGSCKMLTAAMANTQPNHAIHTHKFSVIELASFIDLTPWHRFGFVAANTAVLEAIEGFSAVHIVDLSLTHCMQMPTLIDAIANRPEGPPFLKLTVGSCDAGVPPMLDISYEDLGAKLVSFARSRNVAMEFKVIPSSYSDGFASLIEHLRVQQLVFTDRNEPEALVINGHMKLHYIPDETLGETHQHNPYYSMEPSFSSTTSLRSAFLKALRSLNPTIVVLVDEDADFTSTNLVSRLRSAFNFLWIPYDAVDTCIRRGSKQMEWYEADLCWKIENVIAQEDVQRVERLESKSKWVQRMRNANFRGVSFSEEAVTEIKHMLDEHAAGWGLKKEDEEDHLVLTWKGHNVVFATAWVPSY